MGKSSWKASLANTQVGGKGKLQPLEEGYEEEEYYEDREQAPWDNHGGDDADYWAEDGEWGDEANPRHDYYLAQENDGPTSWMEVDETQLEEEAEQLYDSVARLGQANEKGSILEQLLQTASTGESKDVLDPLGLGILDTSSKAIVKEKDRPVKSLTVGRKRGGKSGKLNADAAAAEGDWDGLGTPKGAALPREVAMLLPNQEEFSPEAFLGAFHQDTRESSLRKGVKTLTKELSERTGQLKQLIRENFERFTSCQSTIDDIYSKLSQAEGMGFGSHKPPPRKGPGRDGGAAASGHVGGPEGLQLSLAQVQESGQATWGDVLDRAHKVERIRSVANLLNRFNNLFGMPGRIKALAAEGSLAQIVSEYHRASALIRPTATSARVWSTLYLEIERRVQEVYLASKDALTSPTIDPQLAPDLIIFMAQLSKERFPACRDEDSMKVFMDSMQHHLDQGMTECDLHLSRRLARFRQQMTRDPAVRSAALDFAAAWKLQGPSAWQLEPVSRGEGDEGSGSLDLVPIPGGVRGQRGVRGRGRPYVDRGTTWPNASSKRGGVERRRVLPRRRGTSNSLASRVTEEEEEEEESDSDDDEDEDEDEDELLEEDEEEEEEEEEDVGATQELDVPSGPPPPPSSLEDLALLMWPGTNDWRPELDLDIALRADLQWRLAPTTPRSQLLPEPSFRLAPAQSAWAEYVGELCGVLVRLAPRLWTVANSSKYAQVPQGDIPPPVYETMSRAPSMVKRMMEGIMQRYSSRIQTALQALSQAGPLCPALELVVKELCRSWGSLHSAGTPRQVTDGLRGAALSALNLYGVCLETHLERVPQMLFDNEAWTLDVTSMERQPTTMMPSQLQDELCLVMFHFGVLAGRVRDVDESGTRVAWCHLRDGLFTCLSAYTACVAMYTNSIKPRVMPGLASRVLGKSTSKRNPGSPSFRNRACEDLQPSSRLEQAALTLSLVPVPSGRFTLPTGALALQDTTATTTTTTVTTDTLVTSPTGQRPSSPSIDLPLSPSNRNNSSSTFASTPAGPQLSSAFASATAQAPPPMQLHKLARQVVSEAGQPLGLTDESRMLIVISNLDWVRAKVAPDIAQRYQNVLAGAKDDGEGEYTSILSMRCGDMSKASKALLETFMQHKRLQASTQVQAYISLTWSSIDGGGVPTGVSDAALALVAYLVDLYTLVVSYCPMKTLGVVMPALVQHISQELKTQCEVLECTSTSTAYAPLQLTLDIQYMDLAWQNIASESTQQHLVDALGLVQGLLKEALKEGPAGASDGLLSVLSRAAGGRSNAAFRRELSSWAAPLVNACVERTACATACFSSVPATRG